MDPQIERLLHLLDPAIIRLRLWNEDHWATWLEKSRVQIAESDFHGIKHLLNAYGGVGSINDAFQEPETEQPLSQIWSLADQLRREEELARREDAP